MRFITKVFWWSQEHFWFRLEMEAGVMDAHVSEEKGGHLFLYLLFSGSCFVVLANQLLGLRLNNAFYLINDWPPSYRFSYPCTSRFPLWLADILSRDTHGPGLGNVRPISGYWSSSCRNSHLLEVVLVRLYTEYTNITREFLMTWGGYPILPIFLFKLLSYYRLFISVFRFYFSPRTQIYPWYA